MSVDTDMLAIAVLVGGLLVFTAANRDPVEKIDVDPLGQVGMEVDELQPWDPDKQAKKADLGDLNARGQAICAYLRDKTGFMLGIQNFFENGMQNRDAAWLHDNYPDHYALLQTSIEYCNARDTEFRELWLELTSMTGGGLAWMSSNQWIVEVPSNVSNRLRTFFNVSLDSIQRYHQQFVQQMGKQQNALNEALYQQLQQFRGEAFRVIQGQADFFKAFAESQAAQIDRLENQLGQVEMEVDEEGQWLIQNPLENGQIRYQVARNM